MYSSNVILDRRELAEHVAYFLKQPAFAFDLEAQGTYRNVPTRADVSWIGLATHGRTIVVPMGHPIGNTIIRYDAVPTVQSTGRVINKRVPVWDDPPRQLRPSECWPILEPLFFSDQIKIAHHATYDCIGIQKYYGALPASPFADTIVMQWLLNENLKAFGLKELVRRYYKHHYDNENIGRMVEKHPFSKVARYNYLDVKYTWLLYKKFLPQIQEDGIENVFRLEMAVLEVLLDMGLVGAPVDEQRLRDSEKVLAEKLEEVEARIYKAARRVFKIGSVPQKQEILFLPKSKGGQGLKGTILTDSGEARRKRKEKLTYSDYSTKSEALEAYHDNPVVAALLDYQAVSKLLNTYVRSYLGTEDELPKVIDGRVHAGFKQYGTVTGRFSCSEPNLQNIPQRTAEGKQIREWFKAEEGKQLLVADYDQIELRIMAHYAGEGKLLDGFRKGIDPHTMTASAIFRILVDQVTAQMRGTGKAINFALGYGAGPEKVASMAGISLKDAEKFIRIHEEEFPEIYSLKERVINTCKERRPPYIKTLLGRKRRLPTIFARDFGVRKQAERQAFNSLIQGSQADLIKMAMVRLHRRLPQVPGMQLLLTVHDELVTQCPTHLIDDGKRIIQEAMLGPDIQKYLRVKLAADVKNVDRWADAK